MIQTLTLVNKLTHKRQVEVKREVDCLQTKSLPHGALFANDNVTVREGL